MRAFKWLFLAIGLLLVAIGVGMDVSVLGPEGTRVANLDLLNVRETCIIAGAIALLAAVVAGGFNLVLKRSAELEKKLQQCVLCATPKQTDGDSDGARQSVDPDDWQDQVVDHRAQEKPPPEKEDWADQFLESTDEILAKCPECGKPYKLKTVLVGKKAVCKSCGKTFTIVAP